MTDDDPGERQESEPRAGPAPRTVSEEGRLDPMRRTIAERLQESYQNAVHVPVGREVDAEPLLAAADDALDVDVSPVDVLLVAVSRTLDEHPGFNATFEDGVHRRYEEHNVGVAVDVEAGLVAPVIADVGGRTLAAVARERRRLTDLVLAGDHSMSDLRGGTFTVTNLGLLGVDFFAPIIDPPQVAILAVNRFRQRAVPADGDSPSEAAEVTFRRHLPLVLTFDHRVIDGADAARFLGTLAEGLTDPWPLLPEDVESP